MGIAINLYWNRYKTYDSIEAGEYENGIRLFKLG